MLFKLHGRPGEAKRREGWEPRFTGQQASGDLLPPSGASDPGEAMQPRAAHRPRSRRLGPGTAVSILPLNRAPASWGVAAALSPVPCAEPPPLRRAPSPSPGAQGAPWGRGGGGLRLLGPGGWRPSQSLGRPGRDPAPSTYRLPTQRRPQRRRTYRPERAPGAGERAGGQAGGRMCARECACVCVCSCVCLRECVCVSVCDGGRAELCASACAGASVRRSVRPALRPALRARSLARTLHQMRLGCGVAGAAAGSARHPRPRLRPAPGRPGAAPRELRRARGAGGRGARAPAAPRARVGPDRGPFVSDPALRRPLPPYSARSPRARRPRAEVAWTGRAGERENRMHFIHDFLCTGAPGPGCADTATARGTPAGPRAPNPVPDVQADRCG